MLMRTGDQIYLPVNCRFKFQDLVASGCAVPVFCHEEKAKPCWSFWNDLQYFRTGANDAVVKERADKSHGQKRTKQAEEPKTSR